MHGDPCLGVFKIYAASQDAKTENNHVTRLLTF